MPNDQLRGWWVWYRDSQQALYLRVLVKALLVLAGTLMLSVWQKDAVVHYMGF